MAKIDFLDFTKLVETSRKKLVDVARNNKLTAPDDISLPAVVQKLQGIIPEDIESRPDNTHIVRWIGPDGLYRTEYVKHGEAASFGGVPTFDSDILEFVEWVTTSDITNVTKDINCGALYRVKPDAEGKRWTHLYCNISDNTSLTFGFNSVENYSTALIDWGDGSPIETPSSAKVQHTYDKPGEYIIKTWNSKKYRFGGSNNAYISNTSITRFYYGDNHYNKYSGSSQLSLPNIRNIVLPIDPTMWEGSSSYDFHRAYKLVALIVPNGYSKPPYSTGTHEYASNIQGYYINNYSTITAASGMFFKDFIISDTAKSVKLVSATGLLHIPANLVTFNVETSAQCDITGLELEENNSLTTLRIENAYSDFVSVDLSKAVNPMSVALYRCYYLTKLVLPAKITSLNVGFDYLLEDIVWPQEIDIAMNLTYQARLTKKTLLDLARCLKDNTDNTALTLTIYKYGPGDILYLTYINEAGDEVSADTDGAINLIQYIQNKNWTISFKTSMG